jgi:anti-anti-sigma factor
MNVRTMRPCFTSPGRARRLTDHPILIEIEKLRDICFLRFRGDLQAGEHSEYLRAKLHEIETLECAKVLGDLQDVARVGSTGLSFIVGLYRVSGGRLVLARTQPRVREVLTITGLSSLIRLAADVDSGLRRLSGS